MPRAHASYTLKDICLHKNLRHLLCSKTRYLRVHCLAVAVFFPLLPSVVSPHFAALPGLARGASLFFVDCCLRHVVGCETLSFASGLLPWSMACSNFWATFCLRLFPLHHPNHHHHYHTGNITYRHGRKECHKGVKIVKHSSSTGSWWKVVISSKALIDDMGSKI